MLIFRNAFVHRDLWISRWVRFVRALSLGIEALRHKAARGAGAAFIYTYNLTGDRWGPCDRAITGRQLRVTSYKLRVTNVETQKRRNAESERASKPFAAGGPCSARKGKEEDCRMEAGGARLS